MFHQFSYVRELYAFFNVVLWKSIIFPKSIVCAFPNKYIVEGNNQKICVKNLSELFVVEETDKETSFFKW